MRHFIIRNLLFAFGCSVHATISNPKSGDVWPPGSNQMIMWDSTGLVGPCEILLVQAGAKDGATPIQNITLNAENSGSFPWIPEKNIKVKKAEILIVDSMKKTLKSDEFSILDKEKGSKTSMNESGNMTSTKLSAASGSLALSTGPIMALSTGAKKSLSTGPIMALGTGVTRSLSTGPIMALSTGVSRTLSKGPSVSQGSGGVANSNGNTTVHTSVNTRTSAAIVKTTIRGVANTEFTRATVSEAALLTTPTFKPTILTTAAIIATALQASGGLQQNGSSTTSNPAFKGDAVGHRSISGDLMFSGIFAWSLVVYLL